MIVAIGLILIFSGVGIIETTNDIPGFIIGGTIALIGTVIAFANKIEV